MPKKTAADMARQLDGLSSDYLEVHVTLPVPFDVAKHQFSSPVTKCRTHQDCVVVRQRAVGTRRP